MTKRLIIRLSSLGDVILATSALAALGPGENHWVVAREYSELLKGHPKLAKVWEFDRADGSLFAWLSLCERMWNEGYTEVLDLHSTLRSKLARLYFLARARMSRRAVSWRTLNKERLRLYGLFVAKRFWPKNLYPTRLVERFAKLAGGTGAERPDLNYLICGDGRMDPVFRQWAAAHRHYLCVMPSSRWDAKKWGVRGFFEVISSAGLPVVVLGEKSDRESSLLVKLLEQAGLAHFSGIGRFRFSELAWVLSHARALVGNDTGLAHLAEAVGTGVVTVFGPTIPEMGFGPWRSESRSVGAALWCKPCGKDGRHCYRLNERFACQREVKAPMVTREVLALLQESARG